MIDEGGEPAGVKVLRTPTVINIPTRTAAGVLKT
jgi:hypothetical protein